MLRLFFKELGKDIPKAGNIMSMVENIEPDVIACWMT